ncbi:MAG TPA: universal stress protein [Flavitalea sp.]|nr:universal stress protein [Flavitalea sp.]
MEIRYKKILIGSVAEYIIHHASIPVMITPPGME